MVANKPLNKPSFCPDCYLFDGQDVELPKPRAGATYKCPRGHQWSDIEDLQNRQDLARNKRSQLAPKEEPEDVKIVPAEVKRTGTEVVILESDKNRIMDLLKSDFTDGSSLFGSIFSLVQDLKNAEDELKLMKQNVKPGAADALNQDVQLTAGGDLPVTVIVPEQYVVPLKEIAEANDTTVPEYMNAIIANGFDGGWFM
jgi:hypothetical protein